MPPNGLRLSVPEMDLRRSPALDYEVMEAMRRLYLEDFAAGQKYGTGRLRIDAVAIKAFAAAFDPQPFHLDEDAARASFFGGLSASGWHTAAVTMRLLVEGGRRAGSSGPGRRS